MVVLAVWVVLCISWTGLDAVSSSSATVVTLRRQKVTSPSPGGPPVPISPRPTLLGGPVALYERRICLRWPAASSGAGICGDAAEHQIASFVKWSVAWGADSLFSDRSRSSTDQTHSFAPDHAATIAYQCRE